jgi:S-adenosylmethionine:tRNA ribosyltransferase-isomerase
VSPNPESRPTSDFDYPLPRDLIADRPVDRRDASRLMVIDRAAASISHRTFRDLIEYTRPGDALILNETRVFPARLRGSRRGGGRAEVLLLHPISAESGQEAGDPSLWKALVRPGARLKPGSRVGVGEDLVIDILDAAQDGTRIVRLSSPQPLQSVVDRLGEVPLPPYIERAAELRDRERYQTVFAREDGSVAAPTAGLHFTTELLDAVQSRGVRIGRILLHVGVGTFRPVEVEDPAAHTMHAERYVLAEPAARLINDTRREGGRIWAVGTTVARTIETCAAPDGVVHAGAGWTALFIRPPYRFRAIDHLVTNFHLPRSTLLMLVSAFAGHELVMRAYREAVHERYRFYSYGDAMVLL